MSRIRRLHKTTVEGATQLAVSYCSSFSAIHTLMIDWRVTPSR